MTPRQALWLSVGAGATTFALKSAAWWATGSVAFLSGALDGLVNLAAAALALTAVVYARKPPDRDFPYGYGKAEYFSSIFEGILIAVSAVGIAIAAICSGRAGSWWLARSPG